MLPHPDSLALPLKEGIRDLRTSIRFGARQEDPSRLPSGVREPARRFARLADGVLSRAEGLAVRILPGETASLGERMDRLAATLRPGGRPGEPPADLYDVARRTLDADDAPGTVVSELRLALEGAGPAVPLAEDRVAAAATAARWMAGLGFVRPCLSTVLATGAHPLRNDLDARLALLVWLAVLVRGASRADARLCMGAARAAFDAEGEDWLRHLRQDRLDDLAAAWRQTVPYLP